MVEVYLFPLIEDGLYQALPKYRLLGAQLIQRRNLPDSR